MNKKIILILTLGIFLLSVASSIGEISYCCEKNIDGAWCMNEPEGRCDTSINPATGQNYRSLPTSCEATFYCSLGCCYNSQEGRCWENTPQAVCEEKGGTYSRESAECEIPQCENGCCIIGDQAAFVTQTRCKRLTALYDLEINFRKDISSEIQCIASATSEEKGACVFDKEFERTCRILTQRECKELEGSSEETNIEFHQGYLCSAEELGTNCGPSKKTTCVENRDEVFYLDSCGNLANIYDATKLNDKQYWTKIIPKSESCGPGFSNADNPSCGNCNYHTLTDGGSMCKTYDKSKDTKPKIGNNICRDLGCKYEGEDYEHGETWCVSNSRKGDTLPGSEYFRLVCYNGEVTVEPCAAFRQEVCIQSAIVDPKTGNEFKTAACGANLWKDCIAQEEEKDCLNVDKRDCQWIKNGEKDEEGNNIYVCVPNFAPGFDFYAEETSAEETCALANTECVAKFERKFWDELTKKGKWRCVENCHCCINDEEHEGCTGNGWENYKENVCQALGDCGAKANYVGSKGYNDDEYPITCNGGDCYWVE